MVIKSIKITYAEMDRISDALRAEYGNKSLIQWWRKRELGFTVREHTAWEQSYGVSQSDFERWSPKNMVFLDFYDDAMKTFFVLKYLNGEEKS